MKQEIIETVHLIADDGKVFRRIESGELMGKEIYLGYSHYIGGKLLEEPHKDVPEDFEEIDDPSFLKEEPTEIPEVEVVEPSDEAEVTEAAPEEPSESSTEETEENEETTQETEE